MKVLGFAEKKGVFQGNEYHNVYMHCLKDDDEAIGQITEVVKLKARNLDDIFGQHFTIDGLFNIVGAEISLYYDKYGNAQRVILGGGE